MIIQSGDSARGQSRFVKNCYKSKLTAFLPNSAAIDILEVQKSGEKIMKRQQITGLLTVGAIALLNLVTSANIANSQPKTPLSGPELGFVCNQDNQKPKINFPNMGSENDIDVLKGKIALLILTGDCEEAIKNIDEAVKIAPDTEDLWVMKGIISLQLKNYGEALKSFDQVVIINPKNADGWFMKATNLVLLDRWSEAKQSYDETIKIKPEFAEAYMGRGLSHYMTDDVKQAKSDLAQASKLFKKQKNKEGYEKTQGILKTFF